LLIAENAFTFDASTNVAYLSGYLGINVTGATNRLDIFGVSGRTFTVDDNLTGSLLSVNDIAGLPIFEVFSDGTLVGGDYQSGDFIISGNKVGIRLPNSAPTANLHVSGSVRMQNLASGTGAAVLYIASNGDLTSGVAPQGGGGGGSVTLSGPNNGVVTRDGAAGTTLIAENNFTFDAAANRAYLSGKFGINFTGANNPFEVHDPGGALFEVTDDLTSSLMSVNTIAGLPVIEAFANSTVTLGQYGSGDFIITGNKVGIGFSPTNLSAITAKLHISGNTTIVGTLSKTAGTFEIPHPNPIKSEQGYKLRHSFVESPTRGDNIYRYNLFIGDCLSGQINLPDYWKYLNENPQVWISPVDSFGIGYGKVNENLTEINIRTNMSGEYNVLLLGTRKDQIAKDMFDAGGVEFI